MAKQSVAFIVNPYSDISDTKREKQERARQGFERIKKIFREEYHLEYIVSDKLHPIEICSKIDFDFNVVLVFGGDGTNNEVLNGLSMHPKKTSGEKTVIGILPGGFGNDFAGDRKIKSVEDEIEATVNYLRNPKDPRGYIDSDVIQTEIRLSDGSTKVFLTLNAGGIGIDALTIIEFNRMRKENPRTTYSQAFFSAYRNMPKQMIKIKDGKEQIEVEALSVVVSNTPCFGKGIKINPNASHVNRRLDYTFVRTAHPAIIGGAFKLLKLTSHIPYLLNRRNTQGPLEVTIQEGWQCQTDGEFPYEVKDGVGVVYAKFTNLPAAQRIIVPDASNSKLAREQVTKMNGYLRRLCRPSF
jgi:diacylglycerol kinase family enzyme